MLTHRCSQKCQSNKFWKKQKLCSIHKNKILSGGISQNDDLEAGKITYEDPSLLVGRKFVKMIFAHQIRW